MYEAVLIAPDGDVVYDAANDTIDDVWNVVNDYGSRWIFYPIRVVVEQWTDRIVSVCDELPTQLVGSSIPALVEDLTGADLTYVWELFD